MRHVIVGTAGHIDHGKSALVMALTGTNPDRLEEEKRRGITIDLGFAHLDLGEGLRIAFIDVPGHERFVKNMLAGSMGIDAVMLVVAADESIKPQTREHFDICRLLGVKRGLVALTKRDLVDDDILDLVRLEIQEFVAGSFLEGAPVIPVSARTGEGLEELRTALASVSREANAKPEKAPFRLPIDRAFVMKGFGAVVTGTLIAGSIDKDSEVELFPSARRLRVRGIEVHNAPAQTALAGQRVAVNLSGVEVKDLQRGMLLAPPEVFHASARLDCSLTLLPDARPLRHRARVHFHCWTAETVAEVTLIEGKEIKPGDGALVQLRLAEPGLFLPGDRFIVRQFSPVVTIGGGMVLDNMPDRHRTGDSEARQYLESLESAGADDRVRLMVKHAGEMSIQDLRARTGLTEDEVLNVMARWAEKKEMLALGRPASRLMDREAFHSLCDGIVQCLEHFHRSDPLSPGVAKEELRAQVQHVPGRSSDAGRKLVRVEARSRNSSVQNGFPSPPAFEAALQALAEQRKIEVQEQGVRLAGKGATLTKEEELARQRISGAFEAAGLRVPSADEVLDSVGVDRKRADKLLKLLLQERVLFKVADGLIFHHSALEGLRELLARRKQQDSRLSVPAFKELTGVSRKYAIPLLEYLDRERMTRRSGDERIIL
jgi:selenocysteine-specific elongation factor